MADSEQGSDNWGNRKRGLNMTETTDTDQSEIKQVATAPPEDAKPTVRDLGNRLRVAREAKKLTPQEVAERLHFPPSRVTFIENDEYGKQPRKSYYGYKPYTATPRG